MPPSPPPEPATRSCPLCGLDHRVVPLAPGDEAQCVRCGTILARGGRPSEAPALAWSLTGLVLLVPALALPLATVGRLGLSYDGHWFGGVRMAWQKHMPELSLGVFFVGLLAPMAFLALQTAAHLARRGNGGSAGPRRLLQIAEFLERWAMPEVYVLAVLVAFIKLGTLVTVDVGAGLWCYGAAAFALLKAGRALARLREQREGSA